MDNKNYTIPEGMDQSAVNLARAIRQQESGGDYNKPGDSGKSYGAYQWNNGDQVLKPGQIPANFKRDAEEVGLNGNDFSPKNQDMVAYNKIKKLKDAGKNVVQIAAMWNGGDENRYDPNYITPSGLPSQKAGVYDVPTYAKNVNNYYQDLKSKSSPETIITPPDTTITPEQQKEPGILSQSLGQFGKGYNQISQGVKSGNILDVGKGILNEAAGGLRTVFSPIEWATKLVTKIPGISNAVGGIDKGVKYVSDKIAENPALQKFVTENPDAEEVAGNLLSIGTSLALGKLGGKVGEKVSPITSTIKEKVTGGADLTSIQQKIMPKSTIGEARIALKEGRLVPGKEPGVVTSGTAGEILPSEKVIKASKTIKEQIPGAAKMDDQKLFTSLDSKIGEISQKIRPDMEKVKITTDDLGKLNDDINSVHAKQLELADASEEANLTKRQTVFKSRLSNIKEDSNLAEVWDERIDYDNSIPTNVKKANSQSPESLQNKKSEWLENRSIYNDLIHMKAEESGISTQKAFSDMSDMFNAQSGLLSDAKSSLSVKPSKLRQWIKKNPVKSALIGAGVISQLPGTVRTAGSLIGL